MRTDPLLDLSSFVMLWAFIIFWVMPGARGRYMIPAYPFMALMLARIFEVGFRGQGMSQTSFQKKFSVLLERLFRLQWKGWILLACLWGAGILS